VLRHTSEYTLMLVVKSQAEALQGDVTYDYCLITTKCLPDVLPTPKLVEDVIKSGKVKAWSLIQVSLEHLLLVTSHARMVSESRRTCTRRSNPSTHRSSPAAPGSGS